jgi:hypothetical protein
MRPLIKLAGVNSDEYSENLMNNVLETVCVLVFASITVVSTYHIVV